MTPTTQKLREALEGLKWLIDMQADLKHLASQQGSNAYDKAVEALALPKDEEVRTIPFGRCPHSRAGACAFCYAESHDVILAKDAEKAVLEEELARVYSQEPCPKCGCGVSSVCLGCKLSTLTTNSSALVVAMEKIKTLTTQALTKYRGK